MKQVGVVLVLAALAASVHAGTITSFSSPATFDAAVGPTTTETFDAASQCIFIAGPLSSAGDTCSFGSVAPGDIQAGVTYSVPSIGYARSFAIDSGGVLGSNHILDSDIGVSSLSPGSTPLTATFSSPVSGVGFDEYNIDGATSLSVLFNFVGGGSTTENEVLTGAFDTFFGFESSAQDIASIEIDTNGTHYEFAVDNFTFTPSSTVPEPATLLPLAGALVLMYFSYRRRRSGATR